jgi:hypothetical protein
MIKRKAKFDREFPKHLDKSFPIESPLSRFNLAFKKSEKKVSNGAAADADSTSEVHGDPSIVVSDRNISDSLSLALPGLEGSTVSAVGHRNSVLSHSQSTVSNKGNAENKTPNPTNTTSNHEKSAKRLSSMAKKGSSHNISGDDILGDPFFLDDSDSDTYYDDERYRMWFTMTGRCAPTLTSYELTLKFVSGQLCISSRSDGKPIRQVQALLFPMHVWISAR